MSSSTPAANSFNEQVIQEFRARGGRVGGPFEGSRLLLLTTRGARTGAPRTHPLGYLPDGGERLLVIASAGGSPRHPDWYHNVLAHPQVTVEDGLFTYEATAEVLRGAERDRVFARAVESEPGWGAYQERAGRVLPVVALRAAGLPWAGTPSETIRRLHEGFRRELAAIRREIEDADPTGLGAQLRVNCLTLCLGLRTHHAGEDAAILPAVERSHPEVAPVIRRLREEHRAVAALTERLREVVNGGGADREETVATVTELTGRLEAHLDYEEEHLLPFLDG
ncbi:nitroreductase/quinone reductase family protein [Streptomyces triticirhizae]|uniref:Nitroreductase family deazaflavin-dependent oxidoreductase n=1 Tax=Streptomyces triticirhizae TaxID=2483353 RepID=A0A3M2LT25_9ACTN|nr:nitroreductase/quinone reductase family protein [Streptomyces triticirhizae]RMI40020.1 nitroreductase family deazaflavin-dependent oxidoreductase [Streptomyces triticirhizae]